MVLTSSEKLFVYLYTPPLYEKGGKNDESNYCTRR
ncbi:hypothetical protein NRS6105_13180 [Bacillus subtilis]|nr:hypothetical protein NRS6105_01605 [Bacillus subtilis]CAF1821051.1 hypothetical protein NRS6145_01679 [Bacillus subtilis]CAI6283851.1 hypothetical protein NRS6145_13150 [Bacillus subtilis]CAI6286358.1 hypothetical protein NRS6105_13180 [Bacillus subtilis]